MKQNPVRTMLMVLVLLASLASMPMGSGADTPYSIYGVVTDSTGFPVEGALVYVNNTNTTESLTDETGIFGTYNVDISSNPGNVLELTALYHQFKANETLIVSGEPAQRQDLMLAMLSHIIKGLVLKPDASTARIFSVVVANQNTNESDFVVTNTTGHYRMDIGVYESGFSEGDPLIVSCNFIGFSDTNSTVVTNTSEQVVNLFLSDVEPPKPTIFDAPGSVPVNTGFNIVAWVTDNFQVTSVSLYLREVGQGIYSMLDMYVDDGAGHDWDSNGFPEARLFGRSIAAQSDIGTVYYYVETDDGSFTNTTPENNPDTNPYEILITDSISPTITHTPVSEMEAGVPRNLLALVDDNIEVDDVTLWLAQVGETVYSPMIMTPTGTDKEYNATIPAQLALGTLRYYISANDTSNNVVRHPPTGNHSVNVVDTTLPGIVHVPINSANVDDPINFTAGITDIMGLDTVWINFTDVLGDPYNYTMTPWGVNMWTHVNQSGQNPTGVLYYTIWALDNSWNLNHVSHATEINDVGTPVIIHDPVLEHEVFEPISITARVTDDVGVTGATLCYKSVSEANYISVPIILVSGTDQDGVYTAQIPSQGMLGIVQYYINATDGTNNISHPALAAAHDVSIVDTTPPSFESSPQYSTPQSVGDLISIDLINITDNYMVGDVLLYYRSVDDNSWVGTPISSANADARGNGTYTATIPAQTEPGNVTFYIFVNDSCGNNATLPEITPRLNPYVIQVIDAQPPEITLTPPSELQVNQSCGVNITVTDDVEVTQVSAHYKGTLDTAFSALSLFKVGTDTYRFIFPPQNRSGTFQLYISASDGAAANQTQTYSIPVINNPPTIIHENRSMAAAGELLSLLATVTDDLHVEDVELSWRVKGAGTFAEIPMELVAPDTYLAQLYSSDMVTIEYHITANDIENSTVWPGQGLNAELDLVDLSAPILTHEPLTNLTTGQLPIITANVSDNLGVQYVHLWFKNSTSSDYVLIALSRTSGNDTDGQYTVLLGRQPKGQFHYYLETGDGTHTVMAPETGTFSVEVTQPTDNWGIIILIIVLILFLVAAFLIYLHFSRKDILNNDGFLNQNGDNA